MYYELCRQLVSLCKLCLTSLAAPKFLAFFEQAPSSRFVNCSIDTTTANDMGMTNSHKQVTVCGEGPALTFMDRRIITSSKMIDFALDTAKKHNIPVQLKRGASGGTDAGEIHKALGGVPCLTIVIPCRYVHSASSVCKLSDIDNAKRLALAALEDMK